VISIITFSILIFTLILVGLVILFLVLRRRRLSRIIKNSETGPELGSNTNIDLGNDNMKEAYEAPSTGVESENKGSQIFDINLQLENINDVKHYEDELNSYKIEEIN
jgi:hypothetical protein